MEDLYSEVRDSHYAHGEARALSDYGEDCQDSQYPHCTHNRKHPSSVPDPLDFFARRLRQRIHIPLRTEPHSAEALPLAIVQDDGTSQEAEDFAATVFAEEQPQSIAANPMTSSEDLLPHETQAGESAEILEDQELAEVPEVAELIETPPPTDHGNDIHAPPTPTVPANQFPMQQHARDAQEFYRNHVQAMRAECTNRGIDGRNVEFPVQVDMCARMRTKAQHECLLRLLQISASEGLITPEPFSRNADASFLGWTGFTINEVSANEFNERMSAMFPPVSSPSTIIGCFRRAGVTPGRRWQDAWQGRCKFMFSAEVRRKYKS